MTTTPGDDRPTDEPEHRTPAEDIEWIGAEVEARPRLMFWGTIAVAVILAIALVVFIVVSVTANR